MNSKNYDIYSKTVVKKVCDKAANRKIDGMHVMVVNSSHWMSEIGSKLSPDCDFALIWYYDHNDKRIKVSLRAFHEHIDVSEISKISSSFALAYECSRFL